MSTEVSMEETGAATAEDAGGAHEGSDVVVYWGSGSPPAWRVTAALVEKGIPHRSELVSFESGVLKTDPFRALNPRCCVPILLDGDIRLYESLAILAYLEDFYTTVPLLPTDKATRALALTRMHESNNVSSAAGEVVYYVRRTAPKDLDAEYLAAKKKALADEMTLWEFYLSSSSYLAGDVFSLADVSFFPNLAYMVRLGFDLAPYPCLRAYYGRCVERECFAATWPPHWKEGPGLPLLADAPSPAAASAS